MARKTLALTDLKSDLHEGISDEELMEKYQLSPEGLKELLTQLVRAMALGSSQVELETD